MESAPFERFTSPTHGDRNPVPGASVLALRDTRQAPAVDRPCRKIDAREGTATKFNAEGAGGDNASCNAKPSFGWRHFNEWPNGSCKMMICDCKEIIKASRVVVLALLEACNEESPPEYGSAAVAPDSADALLSQQDSRSRASDQW
jgi:hypothetical protein